MTIRKLIFISHRMNYKLNNCLTEIYLMILWFREFILW
jgi:hypothetical protein